nr:MAG TPA: Prion-like protein Doppel [Caudoviricetes sp.]
MGWNVAFVCKGLFCGLSLVDPDELSGLACKSV